MKTTLFIFICDIDYGVEEYYTSNIQAKDLKEAKKLFYKKEFADAEVFNNYEEVEEDGIIHKIICIGGNKVIEEIKPITN